MNRTRSAAVIGIERNPARDPKVKLPKRVTEEANPPSDEHFVAILDNVLPRWRLFFITVEQGGLRIGEAAALRWADVDAAGLRLRLPKSATKTNQSRWLYLPQWLMDALEAICPLEDRVPERRVFQGLPCLGRSTGDGPRVPGREDPARLAPRHAPPPADDLASGGRAGAVARGAGCALQAVFEPRRLDPCNAGRRRVREVSGPDPVARSLNGVRWRVRVRVVN